MIDKDAAKSTLIQTLVKWLILGILILGFRFFRWGGIVGLIGIAVFAGAWVLSSRFANDDAGGLSTSENTLVIGILLAGAALYIFGVQRRRRRSRLALTAAVPAPR